ncbi:MAG: hypothetical protein JO281_10520 [Pseudonocardiales bacterium]|nr:hypothetical protein [Pseudonocardiales bacterium]
MRSRSVLLTASACLATVTLTMGTAAADPPTPPPQFGHPPCTVTSSPTSTPQRSVATPQSLAPVTASSPTTPLVSTPTPTATTPTATTIAGCITAFTTPHGNSANVLYAAGDGNLWFADGSNIVRMLSRAPYTQTDFPIPGAGGTGIGGITTDSDGNIWFAEQGFEFIDPNGAPGKVARILTHAPYTVTEFPLPGAVVKPAEVATGGDGNIWVSRGGTPEIDRILAHTPYTITRFPLPAATPPQPANVGPQVLLTDPQGNLWFNYKQVGHTVGDLGEISPFGSHQSTLFDVGAGNISVGPRQDPNSIWFIDVATPPAYRIGRIDTITHAVTKYPVTLTGLPGNISPGPDGNMWITEIRTGYAIGRFQTHAPFTFSEIPLPDDTYAIGLTCGPDGNEWFSTNHVPAPPDNPQGNPAIIGRINLTKHDGLPGLTGPSDVLGNGLAGDLQSLLGGLGHDACPAPTPGI